MQLKTNASSRTSRCDRPSEGAALANSRGRPVRRGRRPRVVRNLTALLVVLAVTIVGVGPASAAQGGRDRPLKGSGSGVGTVTIVDGQIRFSIDGTQRLTHLGRSSYRVEGVCTNADCTMIDYTATNVAANGDTYTTISTGGNGSIETITGGTGRFEGATGTQVSTGTTDFDPTDPLRFTNTFESRGTISY